MAEIVKQKYHTHITSERRWFDLNLKEVSIGIVSRALFYPKRRAEA